MKNSTDLTNGNIFRHLVKLALPIMGASLMQMAYNLTDMFWLGRLGSNAVASVGVAGIFVWFGTSFLLIPRIGAEVGVSQSAGRKNVNDVTRYARHSLFWAGVLALLYALLTSWFSVPLISIFNLESTVVVDEAVHYLRVVSIGFIFTFMNPVFTGIYNGLGNSRKPFVYLSVGLVSNVILDPLFIFGWGPIPAMGVAGAAWATVVAQLAVWSLFVFRFLVQQEMVAIRISDFKFNYRISLNIFKVGLPVAVESCLFAFFAMILTRMMAPFGEIPIAVQSIGAQIEAISWMTASGFATALASFTGQNFGSRNWERIQKGYFLALSIGLVLGLMVTFLFVLFGEHLFALFLSEEKALELGIAYLKILAVSQVFMIFEITTRGAFNGIGRSIPPSVTGIVFTGLRVPLAMILIAPSVLGLFGIWWAITLSSVVKGFILPLWFILVLVRRYPEGIPLIRKTIRSKMKNQFGSNGKF